MKWHLLELLEVSWACFCGTFYVDLVTHSLWNLQLVSRGCSSGHKMSCFLLQSFCCSYSLERKDWHRRHQLSCLSLGFTWTKSWFLRPRACYWQALLLFLTVKWSMWGNITGLVIYFLYTFTQEHNVPIYQGRSRGEHPLTAMYYSEKNYFVVPQTISGINIEL